MRCVGHRVAPSRSATVCRLSAAARAGPCALGGSCAPGSALAAPGATARWKRLGRSTTKKRMAVVLGRQDGARRRRDMPKGAVTARGQRPGEGGMACADGTDAKKRQDGRATRTTMAKKAKAAPMGAQVQQGLGGTGPGLAQGNPRPGSGRQEAWQAAAVTACWVSLQQLALSTLGLRK